MGLLELHGAVLAGIGLPELHRLVTRWGAWGRSFFQGRVALQVGEPLKQRWYPLLE